MRPILSPNAAQADISAFKKARQEVEALGYDLGYIGNVEILDDLTETKLLREMAWVVLCSGFRERTIRRVFSKISLCFLDWESASNICWKRNICIKSALDVFNSKAKIEAIADGAQIIAELNFNNIKDNLYNDPISTLRILPYIGPITVFHLAKNLGIPVPKPDRHLTKMSQRHGYDDPLEFCCAVADLTGLPIPLVDTILWRFSERGWSERLLLRSVIRPG